MRFILLLLSLITYISSSFAQNECLDQFPIFAQGESLKYIVYYNLGPVWINAGDVVFEVNETTYQNEPCYQFLCSAKSTSEIDWFFCVRDTFECVIRKNNPRPYFYRSHSLEGSADDRSYYIYQNDSVLIEVNNKGEKLINNVKSIDSCTFDMLSTAYSLRGIDTQNLQIGDSVFRKTILDGNIFTLPIIYKGLRNTQNINNKTVKCHCLALNIGSGSIFMKNEPILIYTDDKIPSVPILIEAQIKIGSIKIFYTE